MTFSVATLGISTCMLFGLSVQRFHHIDSGFRYLGANLFVLLRNRLPALPVRPSHLHLDRGKWWGIAGWFGTCLALPLLGCLQGHSGYRRTILVLGVRKALGLASAGYECSLSSAGA